MKIESLHSLVVSQVVHCNLNIVSPRNHLNDLENIPVYLIIGLLYVLTGPSPGAALWHFRLFTGSRIVHTISYQLGLQPWRALSFMVGLGVIVSMAIQILTSV